MTNNNNNNTKKIQFNLHKSVQVTKVFVKENQRLTKNDTIFTMVDTDNPGIVILMRRKFLSLKKIP
jgi:multidrug efflux pump subunit AcrA (membrane-fusion protein)